MGSVDFMHNIWMDWSPSFYLGKIGSGLLYFFTFGVVGLGVLYDFIIILGNKMTDKNGLLLDRNNASVLSLPNIKNSTSHKGLIERIKDYAHDVQEKYNEKKDYTQTVETVLKNDKFTDNDKNTLAILSEKYNLSDKEVIAIHKDALKKYMKVLYMAHAVTDDQLDAICNMQEAYNLGDYINEVQPKIYLYNVLWNIQINHVYPNFTWDRVNNIIPKTNEVLHWFQPGQIIKIKNVTKSIHYAGPTASIKIAKGIHYRMGSVDVGKTTEQVKEVTDTGEFWISNQRIGFIGNKTSFTIPINKIMSFDLDADLGLKIFKENTVNPKSVQLTDYEVAYSLLSSMTHTI